MDGASHTIGGSFTHNLKDKIHMDPLDTMFSLLKIVTMVWGILSKSGTIQSTIVSKVQSSSLKLRMWMFLYLFNKPILGTLKALGSGKTKGIR